MENEDQSFAYEKPEDLIETNEDILEEKTYPYEGKLPQEVIVRSKREELKKLKIKAAKDKKFRLAKRSERRNIRDDKLDRIRLKLKTIKKYMAKYNRAGKKEKNKTDILGIISNLINNDEDLIEEIERTRPKMSEEEFKTFDVDIEAVSEEEISPPGK